MQRVADARAKAAAENPRPVPIVSMAATRPKRAPIHSRLLYHHQQAGSEPGLRRRRAQFGGGSLIAPNWVLTAAHCLNDKGKPISPDAVTVLTGATELSEGKRHKVLQVIVNEGYSEQTLDNDLGLLRLEDTADAPTIKLTHEATPDTGKTTVTGWGKGKMAGRNVPDHADGCRPRPGSRTRLATAASRPSMRMIWKAALGDSVPPDALFGKRASTRRPALSPPT